MMENQTWIMQNTENFLVWMKEISNLQGEISLFHILQQIKNTKV